MKTLQILISFFSSIWLNPTISKPTDISLPIISNFTTNKTEFDFIIFGKFCQECFGDSCTVMYKLDIRSNKLYVNRGSRFYDPPWSSQIDFKEEVRGENSLLKAREILDRIPKIILNANNTKIFGRPDEGDQCGLFFLTKEGAVSKITLLDYNLPSLNGEIREFAKLIKKNISDL